MKNSNDTIGNRTSDLPSCSAVPVEKWYILKMKTELFMKALGLNPGVVSEFRASG